MFIAGDRMIRTPDCCRGNTCLFVELDDVESISASAFDHIDINAKPIGSSMSATNMDIIVAALEVAFHCRQACGYAIQDPAFLIEALSRNKTDTLCVVEDLSIAELDLFRP
jgi:hypothetical protein